MTTATFSNVARHMKTNVERLRENDKVCLICDAVQLQGIIRQVENKSRRKTCWYFPTQKQTN